MTCIAEQYDRWFLSGEDGKEPEKGRHFWDRFGHYALEFSDGSCWSMAYTYARPGKPSRRLTYWRKYPSHIYGL